MGILFSKSGIKKATGLMLFCALISVLATENTYAQKQNWKKFRYELSLGLGPCNFLGELGGSDGVGSNYFKDLNFMATRYAITGGLRYKMTDYTAVRANLSYGRVFGDDRLSNNFYRNYRNLNFRSNIFEAAATFEGSIFKESLSHRYRLRGPIGRRAFQIYTYLFAGIGIFYFNPEAYYRNDWVPLRKLTTEGQGLVPTRKIYANWQMCIPVGIGFRYTIDQRWGIGVEFGFRTTFTDYIDDVSQTYFDLDLIRESRGIKATELSDRSSGKFPEITAAGEQRGNPNNTDAYMFTVISVNYKLRTSKKYRFHSGYYKDISPLF